MMCLYFKTLMGIELSIIRPHQLRNKVTVTHLGFSYTNKYWFRVVQVQNLLFFLRKVQVQNLMIIILYTCIHNLAIAAHFNNLVIYTTCFILQCVHYSTISHTHISIHINNIFTKFCYQILMYTLL